MNTIVSPRAPELRGTLAINQTAHRTFDVDIEQGLHARPCALLVKAVKPYHSTVEAEVDGNTASAKSILGLMALAAAHGSKITFTIVGEDAFQAMAAVHQLFEAQFGEGCRASAHVIRR